jgi:hypothetical protein
LEELTLDANASDPNQQPQRHDNVLPRHAMAPRLLPNPDDGSVEPQEPIPLELAPPTLHRFAAAQAVLAPVCDLTHVTFPPRLETVRALQALWRCRLHQLQAGEWEAIQRRDTFDDARNCLCTVFAHYPWDIRPCGHPQICPF